MKSNNWAVVVVALLCLFLGVTLLLRHKNAEETTLKQNDTIAGFSNNLQVTTAKLEEVQQAANGLEQTVKTLVTDRQALSNRLVSVTVALDRSEQTAKATADALGTANQQLKLANDELTKRRGQIESLAAERDDQAKLIAGYTNALANLEKQISDTQRQLASSEGDRSILLKELRRLQTEKSDLEHRLNDLAEMRQQVDKLKDELAVNNRLEFMRAGLKEVTARGGATLLMRPPASTATAATSAPTNYNLNVEVRSDGTGRVATNTNSPGPLSPK